MAYNTKVWGVLMTYTDHYEPFIIIQLLQLKCFQLKEKGMQFCTFAPMKKLLLLILFILNLVLLQAQKVEFISVNGADTTLENITFKRLPKLLVKDSLTADTLANPAKWMIKLQKKLTKQQRQDSNIYIFFCPSSKDSLKAFLPLSGKYGYVLFDSAKVGVVELERVQKRLSTHKYQWDAIHDPGEVWGLLAKDKDQEKRTQGFCECQKQYPKFEDAITHCSNTKELPINNILYGDNQIDDATFYSLLGEQTQLSCKFNIKVAITELTEAIDITEDRLKYNDYDYIIYMERMGINSSFAVLGNNVDDEFVYYLNDITEYLKEKGDERVEVCILKSLLQEIGEYNNIFLSYHQRPCFKKEEYYERTNEQTIIKVKNTQPELYISSVRTNIDINGKIRISWKSNCNGNWLKYSINHGPQLTLMSPNLKDGEYYFDLPCKRSDEIDYNIYGSTTSEPLIFSGQTGNFQGADISICKNSIAFLGNKNSDDNYNFFWTDENGGVPAELNANNKIKFLSLLPPKGLTYKITRTHIEKDLVDEALVKVTLIDGCVFDMRLIDLTPPPGSGPRIASEINTQLEVIPVYKNLNEKDVELVISNSQNQKGWDPRLIINQQKATLTNYKQNDIEMSNYKLDIKKAENYKITVNALGEDKSINSRAYNVNEVDVFEEDIKDIKLDNFKVLKDFCNYLGNLNDIVKPLEDALEGIRTFTNISIPEFTLPINCKYEKHFKSYLAEKWNSPIVIKDFKGVNETTITFDQDFPIPKPMSLSVEFSMDPIKFVYDGNIRKGSESSFSFSNVTGYGKIKFCPLDISVCIATTKQCIEIPFFITVENADKHANFSYMLTFGVKEIKLYFIAKPLMGDEIKKESIVSKGQISQPYYFITGVC